MGREFERSLLTVESPNGTYANGFILDGFVVTAHHVVGDVERVVRVPKENERGVFKFHRVGNRDVSVSDTPVWGQGFLFIEEPVVGEEILIVGHHGEKREYFEIKALVTKILEDGGVMVEELPDQKPFQLGMSGSAGVTSDGKVVGVLSKGGGRVVELAAFGDRKKSDKVIE